MPTYNSLSITHIFKSPNNIHYFINICCFPIHISWISYSKSLNTLLPLGSLETPKPFFWGLKFSIAYLHSFLFHLSWLHGSISWSSIFSDHCKNSPKLQEYNLYYVRTVKKKIVLQVHIHITRPHTSLLFTKISNTCLCKAQLPEVIT